MDDTMYSRDQIDLLKFNSFELSRAIFGYSFFFFLLSNPSLADNVKWKTMNRHENINSCKCYGYIPTRIVGIVQGILAFALVSTSLVMHTPCRLLTRLYSLIHQFACRSFHCLNSFLILLVGRVKCILSTNLITNSTRCLW